MQRIISLALCCAAAAPAVAFDHTVDFESFPGMLNAGGALIPAGSRLSDQLQDSIGISFRSNAPYVAVVNLGTNHATSGTRGIAGSTAAGIISYSASTPIDFTFWLPTNTAQAAGTNQFSVRGDLRPAGGQMSLTAYDLDDNVIDSVIVTDTGGNTMVLDSVLKNIHRVRFVGTGNVALDDVSFNSVEAVPEPTTIAALGMGALALIRRRGKDSSRSR